MTLTAQVSWKNLHLRYVNCCELQFFRKSDARRPKSHPGICKIAAYSCGRIRCPPTSFGKPHDCVGLDPKHMIRPSAGPHRTRAAFGVCFGNRVVPSRSMDVLWKKRISIPPVRLIKSPSRKSVFFGNHKSIHCYITEWF